MDILSAVAHHHVGRNGSPGHDAAHDLSLYRQLAFVLKRLGITRPKQSTHLALELGGNRFGAEERDDVVMTNYEPRGIGRGCSERFLTIASGVIVDSLYAHYTPRHRHRSRPAQ